MPRNNNCLSKGAPANRAIWLKGLTHSPPLHATHLTGTVSGLCGLSFKRPLRITKWLTEETLFHLVCSSQHGHGPVFCLRLIYYIDLYFHSVRQITLANGNYEKFTSHRHVQALVRGLSYLGQPG